MIEPRLRFKADDGSDFPDWEEKTLGELGTFTKGAALSKADISDEGNPLILYGELYTTYKEVAYEVKRKTQAIVDKIYYSNVGDVLIPTSGESAEEISTATCVMVPNVILAGDLNIFRSTVIDGRIMSYILNYQAKRKIATIAQGKSIVHIQAKQLGKIFVEYPVDKDEQQKIADFLSTIDTIIEKQRATVSAWEERKKGVIQKLFSQEVRFKADDGSDFPDWEEKKLEEVSNKIKVGFVGTCDCFYVEKHGVKLYRTGNLIDGKLVDTDMKYVTRQFHEKNKKSQLKKWDILIARHGNSGHAVLYDSDEDANCLNIVIIQPNLDLVNPRFLTNNINSSVVEKQVYRLKGGSTQVVLNTTAIEKIKVSIPSLPEQQKIADCLSALDAVIEKQKETLEKW